MKELNMSEPEFQNFIKGDIVITKDIAVKLETFLGVQAQFWLNLDSNYQEDKKKLFRKKT